ncbi:hypothetical protein [Jeongeupia chitinilytica]|uniref:Uncharacterized protein n=1 Tax=Jeongeupia chitinilytica TaxID=1041641 RepID=A0ABQ3H3X5_9NEIS|nr:hypothetical protein [Jeongeupia chitinilytica]GHD66106.1 hypothetical protein GCM10007350_27840 [Jeongeupia chitinilytica]
MLDISARMQEVLRSQTPERGRFRTLEEKSGIKAGNWKSFWYGKQRANSEMIEWVCQTWPEYAFWLVTGIADPLAGHVIPFSDRFRVNAVAKPWSAKYFRARIALKRMTVAQGGGDEVSADRTGGGVPQAVIDDVTKSRELRVVEIKAFIDDPRANWEHHERSGDTERDGGDEWVADLPNFIPTK